MTWISRTRWCSFILLILVFGSLTAGLGGCTPQMETQQGLNMASQEDLPEEVKNSPLAVQLAYQFAVANPEVLKQIPCYCGCGAMGHTSNYDCYVADVSSSGVITYDLHAIGCSICVDITQDTMRLLTQGKTVGEIRSYIDSTYAQYGPSNIP